MKLLQGFYSDVGNTRKVNQDSILCRLVENKKNAFAIVAVCDGIGGLEHGEIASRIVCECINETFDEIAAWIDVNTVDADIIVSHLKDAVEEANERVFDYKTMHGMQMGTTMSLLIVLREYYYIIQVGDSRVYLMRSDFLRQLTVDATVSSMASGRMKTYLNNYMGKDTDVWYTVADGSIRKEDLFVVCCDGFYHNLKVDDLAFDRKIFNNAGKANEKCAELVRLMMDRGDKDNITVGMLYAKG